MFFDTQEQTDVLVAEETEVRTTPYIVVFNDDYNTFEWVIECFIKVLGHTEQQAEQLALIIHFKGKANVKSGSMSELRPMKDALVDRGLSAVIEEERIES